MADKIIPFPRSGGGAPEDPVSPAVCGFCLQNLGARLERIQLALITVERALREHENLAHIGTVLELCEDGIGKAAVEVGEIARNLARLNSLAQQGPSDHPDKLK
jgi:hypothetical protein